MLTHVQLRLCFLGLVRDVDRDIDPHEGKEWFHANITKEQAYNLLSAGNFTLLIRNSISFIS